MTIDDFWDCIEQARRRSSLIKDVPENLASDLSQLPIEEIVSFGNHLNDCFYHANDACLWLAAAVLRGGCSDDSFDYFRGWLIAQGRHVFETALRNPDSIADLQDLRGTSGMAELQTMSDVDFDAYQKKMGFDDSEAMDRYNQLCSSLESTRSPKVTGVRNSEFLRFSDEEAAELFPKLAARCKIEWDRKLSRHGSV